MVKETVIAFCAHNDDPILGAGGTLAKYAKKKRKVIIVIFSYGELSHPWLKKEVTAEMRLKEAEKAFEVMGCKNIIYMGLDDGKLAEQLESGDPKQKIMEIINENCPAKIFTHAADDPHPDHRAVNNAVLKVVDEHKCNCDVYTFGVWSPIKFAKRDEPKLVIDTTDTFKIKIKAFKCHVSQKLTEYSILWSIYLKDFFNGKKRGYGRAEVFTKVR